MTFITDHLMVVFSGIGTAIVTALVGAWAKAYFDGKTTKERPVTTPSQVINAGNNSTNIQAGGDVDISG